MWRASSHTSRGPAVQLSTARPNHRCTSRPVPAIVDPTSPPSPREAARTTPNSETDTRGRSAASPQQPDRKRSALDPFPQVKSRIVRLVARPVSRIRPGKLPRWIYRPLRHRPDLRIRRGSTRAFEVVLSNPNWPTCPGSSTVWSTLSRRTSKWPDDGCEVPQQAFGPPAPARSVQDHSQAVARPPDVAER